MRYYLVLFDTFEQLRLFPHEARLEALEVNGRVQRLHGLSVVRLGVELEHLDHKLRNVLELELEFDRLFDLELLFVCFLESDEDLIFDLLELLRVEIIIQVDEASVREVHLYLARDSLEIGLLEAALVSCEVSLILGADQFEILAYQVFR